MILTQWIIDSPINKHFRRNYVQGAAAHSGKLVLFRCGTPIKPYKIDIFVGHVWKTSPKIYLPLNTGSTLAALAEGPSCIKLMQQRNYGGDGSNLRWRVRELQRRCGLLW